MFFKNGWQNCLRKDFHLSSPGTGSAHHDSIRLPVIMIAQRTHYATITLPIRQNDVATSFWPNNYVIIVSCASWEYARTLTSYQDLHSLSGEPFHHEISGSFEAKRYGFRMIRSLWYLTGVATTALLIRLPNIGAIRLFQHPWPYILEDALLKDLSKACIRSEIDCWISNIALKFSRWLEKFPNDWRTFQMAQKLPEFCVYRQ